MTARHLYDQPRPEDQAEQDLRQEIRVCLRDGPAPMEEISWLIFGTYAPPQVLREVLSAMVARGVLETEEVYRNGKLTIGYRSGLSRRLHRHGSLR